MSRVTLSGWLPAEEVNGLDPIEDGLLERPGEERIGVVHLRVVKAITNYETGETHPLLKIAQIEPLSGEQADAAERLLKQAYFDRTGATTLPLDELDSDEKDDD